MVACGSSELRTHATLLDVGPFYGRRTVVFPHDLFFIRSKTLRRPEYKLHRASYVAGNSSELIQANFFFLIASSALLEM